MKLGRNKNPNLNLKIFKKILIVCANFKTISQKIMQKIVYDMKKPHKIEKYQ